MSTASNSTASCIFCDALAQIADQPLVVHRGETAYVILNKFPYNNGHLMVVFNRHIGRLADATPDELTEVMTLTRTSELVLTEAYNPHGFNTGLNIGKPAGAGVLDHLHVHIVPRWNGDTNFMPVVAETRVLPEMLAESYEKLRPHFEES